jgi:hypothetical protein
MSHYLIVDIETSGQSQTKNDLMAIGACIGNQKTGEIIDEFQVFLKPITGEIRWEKRCLEEFWDKHIDIKNEILNNIDTIGMSPNGAMAKFHNWVNNHSEDIIIMTDTAGYDIGFINHYLSLYDLPSMNYIIGGKYKPIRDLSSFHMGVGRVLPMNGLWGAEAAALKALGAELVDNPYKASHMPVEDAKSICWEAMQIGKLL